MQKIFFLTSQYINLIKSYGLNLSCLLPENISKHFANDDKYEIDYLTSRARESGNILAYYGLGYCDEEGRLADLKKFIIPKKDVEQEADAMKYNETILKAECPDRDTIVIWVEESTDVLPHLMFKANLMEILRAMARAMSLADVLSTPQFELAVLKR